MSIDRTPQLSRTGTEEVLREMRQAPKDTPERRATFARVHRMAQQFGITTDLKVRRSDDS